MSYALLKLIRPVDAELLIYDLRGRRIRRLVAGQVSSGPQLHAWDGRDGDGQMALPGLYVWRLCVEADNGVVERRGVVGVAR